ncbi:MAG: heavy metal translocating P-type ATPase [Gammaproteobacteria bacterium]
MNKSLYDKICYHCGLPVPPGLDLRVSIDGQNRSMCCAGCQAVAETIIASGLGGFYHNRTASALTAENVLPDFLEQLAVYDDPELQRSFVSDLTSDEREATLIIEGITCPACVWMNEQHLKNTLGVLNAQANFSTRRLSVKWNEKTIKLSEIIKAIHDIGYKAHPYNPEQYQHLIERERKRLLQQLGIAGIMGVQVMMLAIALYTGDFSGEGETYQKFFRWISLFLTVPVILFSSRAFFDPAIRALKHRKLGMDIPVSLGILIAFLGSVKATITGSGEIYFDSVVMFNFFLLTARYLELISRKKASETSENLTYLTPSTAVRIKDKVEECIPVARLTIGDLVLVRPGEKIPADGHIIEGRSSVNESILTGESMPVIKSIDDQVIGGSLNVESPLQIIVDSIGKDSLLSRITHLMEQSQMEKPEITKLADRAASWFIPIILCLTAVTAVYWWSVGNLQWFEIMLSTLVVTCPCALSLATPAALTVATDTLMKSGILGVRGHAIETLSQVDHFVFDKTGTLTAGALQIKKIEILSDKTEEQCLQIAASLEQHSEHPIAKSILSSFDKHELLETEELLNTPGTGFSGVISGVKFLIGNAAHIKENSQATLIDSSGMSDSTYVFLADENKLLAVFVFEDVIRPDAMDTISLLRERVKNVSLCSGDSEEVVSTLAKKLKIDQFKFEMTPDQKLVEIRKLQQQGDIVAMVGDGINDAPVLAGAEVSIAMGSGAEITRANADLILIRDQLPIIVMAVDISRKTIKIIKQNLAWAVLYNVIALPLAITGSLEPWMAAIGMSLSSLIVVTNALRIRTSA